MGRRDSHGQPVRDLQPQRQRRRQDPLRHHQEHRAQGLYALTPEKFNNKTNGISHRRFFAEANPTYAKLVTEAIGDGWLKDAFELEKLKGFQNDTEFLKAVGASSVPTRSA